MKKWGYSNHLSFPVILIFARQFMKHRIFLFFRIYLFWIVFFIISRVVFLLYHFDKTEALTFKETATLFLLGLRMDAAMAGYWCIVTGLLLTASVFWIGQSLRITQSIFILLFLFVSSLVVVADLELYKNWGFRMDTTPLMYIGSEGAGSVSVSIAIKLMLIFVALFGVSVWLFNKTIPALHNRLHKIKPISAVAMLLISGLLFIPIRSSFSVAPLNTGMVYFHKTNSFANHAGINVVWNFLKSLAYFNRFEYPKDFYDHAKATEVLREATAAKNPPFVILNTQRPNVLLVIIESFTSKIIEPLGGEKDITPQLNSLIKEGVLFDHFYASGDRTDKGIVALLSGYPAQPRTSIIKYPNKTQSLSFLPRALNKAGYHTSFVYGGDIGFANMNSYLTMAGFAHLTQDDDFTNEEDNSKWGVHDHIVFNRLLHECDSAAYPFFKTMLTLSSHEPFDVPANPPFIPGTDEASLFLNACKYTDHSLGEFIKQAKTKSWWSNTVVVITADHGHRFPNPGELKEKERFQIPLLLVGGALTKKDTVIHTIGSQTDLAITLLNQLHVQPDEAFTFGKDLLAKEVKPFAVYVFNNGFGYIDNQNEFIYDFDFKNYIRQSGDDSEKKWSEAYMQALFTDYNKR